MKRVDVVYALIQDKDKVLLVKNRKGTWSFPGGAREAGETLQVALLRECMEEANAKVELGSVLCVSEMLKPSVEHAVFFLFSATLQQLTIREADDEIEEIAWKTIAEASKLMPWYPGGVEALLQNKGATYFI